MRVVVEYQSDRQEFDVPDDRLVAAWIGPKGVEASRVRELAAAALSDPLRYPPLAQAVVPGDRVAIALDPATPHFGPILAASLEVLTGAGVAPSDVMVVAPAPAPEGWGVELPGGVEWLVHDPEDRALIAYLATTEGGRRVYLSRHLTDADFVLAIGHFAFDPATGYRGPWSAIFPDLSDAETRQGFRTDAVRVSRRSWDDRPAIAESALVSWLLGAQLQVGITPAVDGVAGIVAGTESELQGAGRRALEDLWTFRPPGRADLVVVGLGSTDRPAGLDELAEGLATAVALVRPGGKIAVISHINGTPSPALGRLIGVEESEERREALKGAEGEPDYPVALRLVRALAAARIYLLSDLEDELVEDLGMVALGNAGEARRLVETAGSVLFVNRAEATRAVAPPEAE